MNTSLKRSDTAHVSW